MTENQFRDYTNQLQNRECKTYVCRYYHDGSWWALDITAYDQADAEARVAKLGNLQLQGKLIAKIPAVRGAGLFTRLLCYVHNVFKGAKS